MRVYKNLPIHITMLSICASCRKQQYSPGMSRGPTVVKHKRIFPVHSLASNQLHQFSSLHTAYRLKHSTVRTQLHSFPARRGLCPRTLEHGQSGDLSKVLLPQQMDGATHKETDCICSIYSMRLSFRRQDTLRSSLKRRWLPTTATIKYYSSFSMY